MLILNELLQGYDARIRPRVRNITGVSGSILLRFSEFPSVFFVQNCYRNLQQNKYQDFPKLSSILSTNLLF
jgi:hypothetical protein